MSNTRNTTPAEFTPRGDMGLGLCLLCVAEAKAAQPQQRKPPNFAIALTPHLQFLPNGMAGLVAIGACWDHIGSSDQPQQQQRRPLLVAQGNVPR